MSDKQDLVERQGGEYSQQERFTETSEQFRFYTMIKQMVETADLEAPDYDVTSSERDKWLRAFWKREPHLAGVLNSVMAIDKNRGWSLVGGRNQVYRYTEILREAEAGRGWRYFMDVQANSYYSADMGAVTELGRATRGGPLRALYHVDPAACYLTGDPASPLKYNQQKWGPDDFFRTVSMPSTDEKLRGLGFCAVSRVLELAKIMIAIYQHDQEMLLAKAPKGLLLLSGLTQQQWNTALESRNEKMVGMERQYFTGVMVLASMSEAMDAKLVALSRLPDQFDLKEFTDLLMYGYALCFGYDASEFWPVQYGALGRGTETQVQHDKAVGKGGMSFVLAFQDNLQRQLPDTLQFEFEQRDDQGRAQEVEVKQLQANYIKTLYEAGAASGMPLLTREQALHLAVEEGLIPEEWTPEIEEEVHTDDIDSTRARVRRDRYMAIPEVRRAAERFPGEPIVRYRWPDDRTSILFSAGADLLRRLSYPVARVVRQSDVLYQGEMLVITEDDVDGAIEEGARRLSPDAAALLDAPTFSTEGE